MVNLILVKNTTYKDFKGQILLFQQVDSCYYIALISFVEEDYKLARMYFEKVVEIGNRMYFVEKAKNYLEKIDKINPETTIDEVEYS